MGQYYRKSLSAERLKRCYDIAPERTIQYLEAEIDHVIQQLDSNDTVLELGCGYGRVLERLSERCRYLVGIDISPDSVSMAQDLMQEKMDIDVLLMDAAFQGFQSEQFDVVLCIQNGLSAFKIEPIRLIEETMRVTKKGGMCLFSSYSDKFWNDRLEWFVRQSEAGLLGEIDFSATKDGTIICKDGFKSSTFNEEDFLRFSKQLSLDSVIVEVDDSSVFWEVRKSQTD